MSVRRSKRDRSPDPEPEPRVNPKLKRCRLVEKYNIHLFDAPIQLPFTCPEHWPASRGELVQAVLSLGQTPYVGDQASVEPGHDVVHRLWRAELRRRAQRVAQEAQLCRAERDNEAEWRSRLEATVLDRLEAEVAW